MNVIVLRTTDPKGFNLMFVYVNPTSSSLQSFARRSSTCIGQCRSVCRRSPATIKKLAVKKTGTKKGNKSPLSHKIANI